MHTLTQQTSVLPAGSLVNARFARNLEHSAQQMLLSFPRGSCLPQCRSRAVPCELASPCFDVCLFGCDKGHRASIISFDSAVIYVIPKCLLDTHWRVTQNVTSESQSAIPSPESTSIRTPPQAATGLSAAPHAPALPSHRQTYRSLPSSQPPCLASPLTPSLLSGHCSPFLEAFCYFVSLSISFACFSTTTDGPVPIPPVSTVNSIPLSDTHRPCP